MSSSKIMLTAVAVLIGGGLVFLGWKMTSGEGDEPSAPIEKGSAEESAATSTSENYSPKSDTLISKTDDTSVSNPSEAGTTEAQLDEILRDTEQPNHVVAQKLLAIAADRSSSKQIRTDALTHGLDLIDPQNYQENAIQPILLNPNAPRELQQIVWDDLADHEDPELLETTARNLSETEGHPLQEEAAEWIEDFGTDEGE
ncbi:hypothetical protein OAK81_01905 [Verrucomicrobiales bacterium]|nr:hypothetical protein [Verrucomicrobiales bacterium]